MTALSFLDLISTVVLWSAGRTQVSANAFVPSSAGIGRNTIRSTLHLVYMPVRIFTTLRELQYYPDLYH
jgi:hypothetical protein